MLHLLSIGAMNKITGEYVYPKIANKQEHYVCPECNKDVIFCNGEIRVRILDTNLILILVFILINQMKLKNIKMENYLCKK